MTTDPRWVQVAVSGPLRRTFTYHLPSEFPQPEAGQRVLVPFGRKRVLGFCLGPAEQPQGFETKPVATLLDHRSLFPPDLLKLCRWMADYYFANAADCLASALPPVLKSRKSARLIWGSGDAADLPADLQPLFRPGKQLTPPARALLVGSHRELLTDLVASGKVVEMWPQADEGRAQVTVGFRAAHPETWSEFFERRKFKPEPFDGLRTKLELVEAGWTDHYLRAAAEAGLLAPQTRDRGDSILDFVAPKPGVTELELTSSQKVAVDTISPALGGGFRGYLLHGITGSGKTLVYCHLARQVLKQGKNIVVLTPEIALSGATLAYLRGFFGSLVTVLHSAMTQRERFESWDGIRTGRYRIVVGPRSAVFAPLADIGLIVVDEEHDGSYKQNDPAPRFHGRDTAVMRAKLNDCPVVLGSASPSLESYHNTRTGRYQLVELTDRPGEARLPTVRLINMQRERLHGDLPYLSYPLKKEVDDRLEREEQAILFLNRRGYSPQVKCTVCGYVPQCPHCEIRLTYHKVGRKLSCHFCGYVKLGYDVCEECGANEFLYIGAGTQKVEEHLGRLFGGVRVLRFDSDTASGRKNGHQLLREFADRQHDLLLGTQMVTKGLDLHGVSLVGVLSADQGLDMPDFRSAEKTFARLLQVAGRSGRGSQPGDVLIQTFYPNSDVIHDAARQDYRSFFEREVESRQQHGFPPFGRLIRVVLSSEDRRLLEERARSFAAQWEQRLRAARLEADLMGPSACPVATLRGRGRYQVFVKTRQTQAVVDLLTGWEFESARFGLPAKVRVGVDVDPDDMM